MRAQTTVNDNLIRCRGARILSSAVIYGANASGESNSIMSLAVLKEIVTAGNVSAKTPEGEHLEPFAHGDGVGPIPMHFEIDRIHQQRMPFGIGSAHLLHRFEKRAPQDQLPSGRRGWKQMGTGDLASLQN